MAQVIEVVTKAEKAYREIRRMITDGRLAQGETIVHQNVADIA